MRVRLAWPLKLLLAGLAVTLGLAGSVFSLNTYRAGVHLERAQTFLTLGQYEAALTSLSKARALTPGNAAVALEQGKANYLLYAFRKDDAYAGQAYAFYQQATRLNPLDAQHFNNLGWSYMLTGRLEEAAAAFEGALERDPHNVYYLYSLGQLRERQADVAGARALYRRALDIKQDRRVAASLEALGIP